MCSSPLTFALVCTNSGLCARMFASFALEMPARFGAFTSFWARGRNICSFDGPRHIAICLYVCHRPLTRAILTAADRLMCGREGHEEPEGHGFRASWSLLEPLGCLSTLSTDISLLLAALAALERGSPPWHAPWAPALGSSPPPCLAWPESLDAQQHLPLLPSTSCHFAL